MPFFLRTRSDGTTEVCETQRPELDVPDHLGKIWIEDGAICLLFPAVEGIHIAGLPPVSIVDHMVRFSADENGMSAAEAILEVRRRMMQGNEALLFEFAKRGTDRAAILQLYKAMLP